MKNLQATRRSLWSRPTTPAAGPGDGTTLATSRGAGVAERQRDPSEGRPLIVRPIRTLLFATDFSETACTAGEWACLVARRHGARLSLVHVLSPAASALPAPEVVPIPPRHHQQLEEAARQRLQDVADTWRQDGLDVETTLLVGPPAPTLLSAVADRSPDLVVAGTRGLTGVQRALLGSTTARLVQDSPAPVLTVHPDDALRQLRCVLVPTDFSDDARLAAGEALRLLGSAAAGSRLLLVHAFHVPAEFGAFGPPPVPGGARARVRDEAAERLAELARRLDPDGVEVLCEAREGKPAEVIETAASECQADLVAMGTRGRSGLERLLLGSTAQRVLPHAPCPVLTVHAPHPTP